MPRSRYSRVAAYLIGVVLGICGPLAMVTPTGAQAPVAEAPAFQVGDEWRYTDGAALRVVAVEGEQVVTTLSPNQECPDCRYYRDKNFTVIKVVDKDGKPVDYSRSDAFNSSVGLKMLDFPLEIGKQWASSRRDRSRSTGRYYDYDETFKVEGYEEIQTKAGTFKAFKISLTQNNRAARWIGQATVWYSPDVKSMVKQEIHTGGWTRPDLELTSYTLK